jgi:8-oxo-dGTP pyrophosphatase MutT (NUDIX family)
MSTPQAAVAILHAREPEESILLIRRAERESDPWSGHWSLPGGKCEPGDADLLETALRELAEECSIVLPRNCLHCALPPMQARRRTPPFLVVAPFVLDIAHQLPATADPEEAVEARWVPLAVLTDPAHHHLSPVPGMPRNVVFPSIDLNGVPLWGFTYRLLSDWLGTAGQPQDGDVPLARELSDFLVSRGLRMRREWNAGSMELEGRIPVAEVLEHLAVPRSEVPRISRVEVRPDGIRLTGLALQDYWIRSVTPACA